MRVQMSIDIAAPPEKVWPYLIEPEKTKQWFTHLKIFEYTSEQHEGVGATFYWEEEARGRIYKLHFITTEWEPNRVFSYELTSGDFFKSYKETWALERTKDGCRFSFDDRIEFPYGPIGKIIGFFGKKSSTESGKEVLAKLKELVEAN